MTCTCSNGHHHLQFGWCIVSLQACDASRLKLRSTYALDADQQGHAILTDNTFPVLVPPNKEEQESPLNLALKSQQIHQRVWFDGEALQGVHSSPGLYYVQLRAYVCGLDKGADTMTAVDINYKTSPNVRLLYQYMESCAREKPASQASLQALVLPNTLSTAVDPHTWRVSDLYKTLPSCTVVTYKDPPESHTRSPLLNLPNDVLQIVLHHCAKDSSHTLRAMEQTCRTLRWMAAAVVPGCPLQLYRHQQHALQWLMIREQARLHVPVDNRSLWLPFAGGGVGGVVLVLKPPAIKTPEMRAQLLAYPEDMLQLDCRGGLLTDEPGLGKTITALALVIKTKGMLPRVPRGALLVEYPPLVHADGSRTQRVGYYAQPQLPESTRRARTGLAPMITQCRDVFPRAWEALVSQADLPTTALTPAQASSIINTERTMLVDLLLSVGKDCSRLQNLKVGDVGGDVPGADVEMADVQDDGDVAAEGATPTSQPSAPVGDQPSTSPANQPDPPPLALHNIDDGIDLHTNPGYGALDGWIAELPSHEMVVQCKLCSKMRLMYKDQYVAFVKQHMIREGTSSSAHQQTPWGWLWGARHWTCLDHTYSSACEHVLDSSPEYDLHIHSSRVRSHIGYYTPSKETPAQPRNILAYCQFLATNHECLAEDVPKGAPANAPLIRLLQCDEEEFAVKGIDAYGGVSAKRANHKGLFGVPLIQASWMSKEWYKAHYGLTNAMGTPLKMPTLRLLSPATLVVAPRNLLDHWRAQLETKFGHDRGRVYEYTKYTYCACRSTIAWGFDVVLVDRNKCSSRIDDTHWLMSHWQRIIVDEGHVVGSATSLRFGQLCVIPAERRWIMTGTPTPGLHGAATGNSTPPSQQDEEQARQRLKHELDALKQHMKFLRVPQEKLASEQNLLRWDAGAHRALQRLLCGVMIRASKADVDELPPLQTRVVTLDFDRSHADSYNQLVALLRVNLITSDWLDENHKEALTHSANTRRMRQFFDNLIQSCNVTNNMDVCCTAGDVVEVLQMLSDWRGIQIPSELKTLQPRSIEYRISGRMPPELVLLPPGHPLYDIQQALLHGGQCDCCARQAQHGAAAAWQRVLVVTPCLHLLCVEHADECGAPGDASFRCPVPGCTHLFVMQPVDDPQRLKDNVEPQWPVPQQLIELQPAWAQRGAMGNTEGAWSGGWEQAVASKVQRLLQDLEACGCIAAVGESRPYSATQLAQLPLAVRSVLVAKAQADGVILHNDERRMYGGSMYGVCEAAAKTQPTVTCFHPRAKAIVFSRHVNHLYLLLLGLAARGANVRLLVQNEAAFLQQRVLREFCTDDTVGVLLMDESGAVGLDLSCASHVFLMEPVLETDLAQQIVARAWRLGNGQKHGSTQESKPPVTVTTYAMGGGSIEEAMLSRALPAREITGEVYMEILMALRRVSK